MICSFAGIFKLILIPRRNLRIPTEFRSEWFEHFLNLSESQNKPIYSDGFRRFRSEFRRNQKIWENNFSDSAGFRPESSWLRRESEHLVSTRLRSDSDGFRSDTIGFGLFCRLRQIHQRFRRIGRLRRTPTDSDRFWRNSVGTIKNLSES